MLRTREDFETVCSWDPALDYGKSDLARFITERDLGALAFRAEERPAVYVLRAIENGHAIDHLLGVADDNTRRKLAFMMSVKLVRDARFADGTGRFTWMPANVAGNEGSRVPLSRLPFLVQTDELNRFDIAAILEVGEVALSRAFLPSAIVGGFVLPPSSERLLTVVRDLYAERIRHLVSRRSRGSNESPEPPTVDGPFDAPGDVHAAATMPPGGESDEP